MKKIIPKDAVLIPDIATKVFQGVIFDVYQWQQKMYDGTEATFERLRRPDTVTAITVVDDRILILEEDQPGRGCKTALPGGRVDGAEETMLQAIKREVREETGFTFANWKLLDVYQPQSKIEWFIGIYLGWGMLRQDKPHLDPGERIAVQELSFEDARRLVLTKTGYLGEVHKIFANAHRLEDLLALPEFQGQEVDR